MRDVNVLTENGVNVKKALELFGDMETYDQTLDVFLAEVDGKLKLIKNYKEIGDMANYAIQVHSLKSDAKYFGFDTLAELSYNHEMESKKNNMFYVTEHYDELVKEANRIINLVKKYMGVSFDESVLVNSEEKKVSNEKAVLIVDDSDIIRQFIKKIFQNDFEIINATDGKEAIDIISKDHEKQRIVAMLLDLNMPNVDGFEVLNYFKEHDLFKDIPVSIITGVDDKESIDKAYKYAISDILLKPFNERDVKKILEKTINYNI